MSIKTLCGQLSEVSIALDAYTDLPDVDHVSVWQSGSKTTVRTGFPYYPSGSALPKLCTWADALDTRILIELSYSGSGTASIAFDLAGHRAVISVTLDSGQAYELGAALQRPVSPGAPSITVAPGELREALAALDWLVT